MHPLQSHNFPRTFLLLCFIQSVEFVPKVPQVESMPSLKQVMQAAELASKAGDMVAPVDTVDELDLDSYSGRWYQVGLSSRPMHYTYGLGVFDVSIPCRGPSVSRHGWSNHLAHQMISRRWTD